MEAASQPGLHRSPPSTSFQKSQSVGYFAFHTIGSALSVGGKVFFDNLSCKFSWSPAVLIIVQHDHVFGRFFVFSEKQTRYSKKFGEILVKMASLELATTQAAKSSELAKS